MISCDPKLLAAAAAGFRGVSNDMVRSVATYLLCQWANGGTPVVPVPVNLTVPVITGTAQVGVTLSGSNGTWTNSPTGYAYRWLADGVAIGGATANTFLLTAAQIGAIITFEVTASNAGGNSAPATSAGTAAVLPAVPVNTAVPVITGTVQDSFTLSGSNGTWTNVPTGYTYQWYANGVAIGGATNNTFLLTSAQVGKTITFKVTASNAGGAGAPATSAATAAVLAVALFYVTTTAPGQILTIAALTVSAAMTVDWGDTNTNSYTGAGARTHTYAAAGTYTVKFLSPLLVTVLNLSDNKITLNSADIAPILNVLDFRANGLKAGTFNSVDVSAWRPTSFYLYSMPVAYSGTFNCDGCFRVEPGKLLPFLHARRLRGHVQQRGRFSVEPDNLPPLLHARRLRGHVQQRRC